MDISRVTYCRKDQHCQVQMHPTADIASQFSSVDNEQLG